ncbi:MAG: arsenic resistance protein, partial [Halothece sp.]
MSAIERLQPLFILLSATVGLILASVETLTQLAESAIAPLLIAVLYATFLPIPLQQFGQAFRNRSVTLTSLTVNFIWTPLLAWGLGTLLLADAPDLRLGLLMLLVTPCTDWYLV